MKAKVYNSHSYLQLLAVVLFCCCCLLPQLAQAERTVRIGYFPLSGYYDILGDTKLTGYGYDYTNAVARQANWRTYYVAYPSWVAAIEALDNNEIDLLAPAQRTPERESRYQFDAFPIGTEYGALLTLQSKDELIFEDYRALQHLRIGCVPSIIFLDAYHTYAQAHGLPAALSYYHDTPALLRALKAGEVDAIIANLMVQTPELKPLAYFGASPIYYLINPRSTGIETELNQAIRDLLSRHPLFQSELEKKYFSHMRQAPLSKEELDYINKLEPITVGVRSNYKPYAYTNAQGRLEGVDLALLEAIGKTTGLNFTYQAIPAEVNPILYAKEHGITLLTDIETSTSNSQMDQLLTSSPYLSISKTFIGLAGTVFNPAQEATIALTMTAPELINEWKAQYPHFTFVEYNSIEECLQAIRKGKATMLLHNQTTMEGILALPRNSDMHVIPATPLEANLCYALPGSNNSAGNQRLLSILNKALTHISPAEREQYIGIYMQKSHAPLTFLDFLYIYRYPAAAALLLLLASAYFYTRIRRAKEKVMQAISDSEQKLQKITNNINGGVVVLEANKGFQILYANDGFLSLIGFTREEFEERKGDSYLTYVREDDLPLINQAISTTQETLSLDLHIRHKNGSYVPSIFNCTVGHSPTGKRELYCVIVDMTEQMHLLEQLRIDQKRTELILSRVDEIFYEVNFQTGTVTCSPSFKERLGWELPPTFDPSQRNNIAPTWKVLKEDLELLKYTALQMLDTKVRRSCTVRLQDRAGHYIWCELDFFPILTDEQAIASFIGLIKNVNDIVTERENLILQTHIDPLTGLYNKEAFEKMATEVLLNQPHLNHAMIFVDLDHFKKVNDTLGHVTGDKAICEAADKLQLIFSHLDIIARFGGDEFCIFVKDIPPATLRGKLAWLLEKLKAEYSNSTDSVQVTCSVGISTTEGVATTFKQLLDEADKALYASKEAGRNRYTFYRELAKPKQD